VLPRKGDRYALADIQAAVRDKILESETLDYKVADSPKSQFAPAKLETIVAKGVSAMANSAGGVLLLGMNESPEGAPVDTDPPGLPEMLGREPTSEQVDRWIRAHVFPNPPATVESVPTGIEGRVYIVITISPSGGGPFRVIGSGDQTMNGRYYYRSGRESAEANHYYLRRLFAEAEDGADKVRRYLAQRGFGDEYEGDFCDREPARRLSPVHVKSDPTSLSRLKLNFDPETHSTHRCVAIAMPELLRGPVIDCNTQETRDTLSAAQGPDRMMVGARQIPTLDGRALETPDPADPSRLLTYLHVHRNGYVEGARCDSAVMSDFGIMFDAVRALQALHAVLAVAGRLQKSMDTSDRWLVALMLRRTSGAGLFAFDPSRATGRSHAPGMRIEETVVPSELSEPWPLLRRFDRRLFNAFGTDTDRGQAVLDTEDGFNRLG